jgi:hypothetical protein
MVLLANNHNGVVIVNLKMLCILMKVNFAKDTTTFLVLCELGLPMGSGIVYLATLMKPDAFRERRMSTHSSFSLRKVVLASPRENILFIIDAWKRRRNERP